MSLPTSSAWEGPESATKGLSFKISDEISEILSKVSTSIPFDRLTIIVSFEILSLIFSRIPLVLDVGTAITNTSISFKTLSKSSVRFISFSNFAPGRYFVFSLFLFISSITALFLM